MRILQQVVRLAITLVLPIAVASAAHAQFAVFGEMVGAGSDLCQPCTNHKTLPRSTSLTNRR